MSTVSELMMYVGIGLVVILAWVFMVIWACKAYDQWQNDPRWSLAVAYIYEVHLRDRKRRQGETTWRETSGGVLVSVLIAMAVVAFFAMISLMSPRAEETVRGIHASGEVQGQ